MPPPPPTHTHRNYSCAHVIPPHQLLALVAPRGPSGQLLELKHGSRGSPTMMDEVGRCVGRGGGGVMYEVGLCGEGGGGVMMYEVGLSAVVCC